MAEEAPNGKRSRMYGSLNKALASAMGLVLIGNPDPEHKIIVHLSSALIAVVKRHQLTVQKFSGAIICEGCGEMVGPDGALCEEMQAIWNELYPDKPE
jgi:hypothetical protein